MFNMAFIINNNIIIPHFTIGKVLANYQVRILKIKIRIKALLEFRRYFELESHSKWVKFILLLI